MPTEIKINALDDEEKFYQSARYYLDNKEYAYGLELLIKAAVFGSDIAKCHLASAHYHGLYGLEKNINKAAYHYFSAAEINSKEINGSIRGFKELKKMVDFSDEMKQLNCSHSFDLIIAMGYLARCYEHGYATAVDMKQAAFLRQKIARLKELREEEKTVTKKEKTVTFANNLNQFYSVNNIPRPIPLEERAASEPVQQSTTSPAFVTAGRRSRSP